MRQKRKAGVSIRRHRKRILVGTGMLVVGASFLMSSPAPPWTFVRMVLTAVALGVLVFLAGRTSVNQADASRKAPGRAHRVPEPKADENNLSYEFLGTAAKEMQDRLRSIAGGAAALSDLWSELDEEVRKEFVDRIQRDSQRLIPLVVDITDFCNVGSRVSTGLRPCNLLTESKMVVDLMNSISLEGLSLIPKIPKGLCVMAHPKSLRRIFEILLASTKVPGEDVTLRARVAGSKAIISLDSPSGRAQNAPRKSFPGTAFDRQKLGMILIRRFAESMNGQFWVEPGPMGGVTYSVSLKAYEPTKSRLTGAPLKV